jgi:phosphohistidine swiveling domain-containing protein
MARRANPKGEPMGIAARTDIRIEELEFEPPSPGSWQLDLTHYPRPVARFITEPAATFEDPYARGFIESLRRYGSVILRPDYRFVHGFMYLCVRPAPEDELPQRFENAVRTFETKLWREDLRRWDEEVKPASIRSHLALQGVDPRQLAHEDLLEHLSACYGHLLRMFEQQYRFVAPALLPTGDFVAQISELTGTSPAELLVLTRGSAPVSAGAEDGLERLAEAIREDEQAGAMLRSGDPPAEILAALRARPGATGRAANAYLEMVECRLIDGFEVGYPCGFELPSVLVKAIRRGVEGVQRERDATDETQRVRERVPTNERARFDELLAEARHTYRLRDERSVYSSVWAMGLMRRAILAAGERLAAEGRIEEPTHLVDATYDEILAMLRGGEGPSAAELAAHSRFRATYTAADAPRALGDPPPPPPPLDQLPTDAARATRAIITAVGLLFTDSEAESETSVVRGLPASPGVYEGTARVLRGPEELGRLRQGDVLVASATSEAFNVVLPLLGALVTDNGGLLAHAAIVAREFGIPGVVGTRDATSIIEDGARVRVDGAAGEVHVLS